MDKLDLSQPSLLNALSICMGAFNGFENFVAQQGRAVPAAEVITLKRLAERVRAAQLVALRAIDAHESRAALNITAQQKGGDRGSP